MAKKRRLQHQKQKPKPGPRHPAKISKSAPNKSGKPETKKTTTQDAPPRALEPTIPFSPQDAILLVGEGDLSFSRALVEHHYCENITATVLEANLEELAEKYPRVKDNVDVIEGEGSKVICGVDAKKMGPWTKKTGKDSAGSFDRICTFHPCGVVVFRTLALLNQHFLLTNIPPPFSSLKSLIFPT